MLFGGGPPRLPTGGIGRPPSQSDRTPSSPEEWTTTTNCAPPTGSQLVRRCQILFGSARRDRFVLDTVLVVGGIDGTFVPAAGPGDFPVDAAFDECTLRSLAGYAPHIAGSDCTLFRGATLDDPVDGMISFTPCLPHGDPQIEARPQGAG